MLTESYRTVRAAAEAGFTEKKSRFIGTVAPVGTAEEAEEFLRTVRARHRDARHHCFAFRLRDGGLRRFSDDGEPRGTAGRPILETLILESLENVMAVVTRYFGGVLLGTGGLFRAYQEGCRRAVAAAEIVTMRKATELRLSAEYACYEKLRRLLTDHEVLVLATDFGKEVSQRLMMPSSRVERFLGEVRETSAGAAVPEIVGECFHPFPENGTGESRGRGGPD